MNLLPDFRTLRPANLADAIAALAEPNAKPLAGGTDLLPNLRRGLGEPATLVDLQALPDFATIAFGSDGLVRIGAGASLEAIAEHPLLAKDFPALTQAALGVAGPTHRAAATLAGNLCQDTRCIFYNQSEWWREANDYCLKLKGDKCHVVVKSDRCYATYHGDIAPALMVLDAQAEIIGPNGARLLAVSDLFAEKGAKHLTLAPSEVIVSIQIPAASGWQSAYEKARVRDAIDFPLAGIAVALKRDGDLLSGLKLAITGTNSSPRLVDVSGIEGGPWTTEVATQLADIVRKTSMVLKTTVMGAKYRRRVVQGMALRLIDRLWAA